MVEFNLAKVVVEGSSPFFRTYNVGSILSSVWIEQQPSKLMVIGSNPIEYIFYIIIEEVAEWLKATDCKSVDSRLRRFESYLLQ